MGSGNVPRKEGKTKKVLKHLKNYQKLKKLRIIELTTLFIADMNSQSRTRATIMLPSTYLNDERYEDYSEKNRTFKNK